MCKNLCNLLMCEGCKLLVYDHCDHTKPGILDLHPKYYLPCYIAVLISVNSYNILSNHYAFL